MDFLVEYKKIFIGIGVIIIISALALILFDNNLFENKDSQKTQVTVAETKNLAAEAEIIEVKEKVIKVAKDDSTDKVEEEVVKYKDKEIVIPKRTVAAAKDAEDGQKQKTAGENATVASFENDGQYVGIDVSSWQGNINWPQVAEAGVQFAMIRVGFRGYAEEGNIKEDAYFRQNIKGAVSNGIKVGIYFYSTARTEDEALQEAAWVVDKIKSYSITYPVAYDFEEFGMHRTASLSGEQATNNAIAFLNYVGSQGFGTMMYANKNDITNRFQKSRLPYKFWLAHYTTSTDYTGSYQMWQRTSKGSVPGISGYVDMDIAYFGYGSAAKPKHTHDFENGTVIGSIVEPTCGKAGYKYMRCKDCSESSKIELPATGEHQYSGWEVDGEKSTEDTLFMFRTCMVCKKTETKTEANKSNNEGNNTVTNETVDKTPSSKPSGSTTPTPSNKPSETPTPTPSDKPEETPTPTPSDEPSGTPSTTPPDEPKDEPTTTPPEEPSGTPEQPDNTESDNENEE